MFFGIIKCRVCGSSMHPDFDKSLDAYQQNEYKNEANLIIPSEDPPIVPDYLIVKCEGRECGCCERLTFKDFFDSLVKFWADMAYKKSQLDASNAYTFDKFATKYLVDRVSKKVITKKDLDGNLVLKDLFEATERDDS